MSEKVILQLRDIIELHAPTNMNYHNKKYLVESIDNGKIVLVSEDDASEETLYVDETTNVLRIVINDQSVSVENVHGLICLEP